MAHSTCFRCSECSHSIESWSDGNPYYIDYDGQKAYAYHPNHELLSRCIGNDAPHLCLNCGMEFNVDSRQPADHCLGCHSNDIVRTGDLDKKKCPFCKRGEFEAAPHFYRIS